MNPCNSTKYAGQQWIYTPEKKILSSLTSEKLCLDIINDEQKNKLIMAPCGNYSGQQWSVLY